MHRDPAFDLDADSADFLFIDPDPAVDAESFSVNVEFFECFDDGLLEIAHPSVEVFSVVGDVENGIGDELSRAVVSDVSAPVRLLNLDSMLFVPSDGVEKIFVVEAGAERHDGIVFEEEESVFLAFLDFGDELELLFESVVVGYLSEVENLQRDQFTVLGCQLGLFG